MNEKRFGDFRTNPVTADQEEEKSMEQKLAEFNKLPNGTRIKLLGSIEEKSAMLNSPKSWPAGSLLTVYRSREKGAYMNGARLVQDPDSFKDVRYILEAGYIIVPE